MQENQEPARRGRDAHVANERRVPRARPSVRSQCVRPVFVHGDHVVIRWIFDFDWLDGSVTHMEELAYQRWEGEQIAEETFFYDPAQRVPKRTGRRAGRELNTRRLRDEPQGTMKPGRPDASRAPPAAEAARDTLAKPALHALCDRLLADTQPEGRRSAASRSWPPPGLWHMRRYAAWVLSPEHLRETPPMV
jgi:hypothetical protein